MATNPMFNNRTSPNGATAPNNPANTSDKRYSRRHNKFNYSRKFYNTLRFAEVSPFEVIRGVEADVIPIGSKHQVRTYTLKSPLMSDIFMRKTFFHVDMRAILPHNWDKWYKAPVIGDDVSDDVGTSVEGFCALMRDLSLRMRTWLNYAQTNLNTFLGKSQVVQASIIYALMMESLYSNGSLLSSLGCHLQGTLTFYYGNNNRTNFDDVLEHFWYYLSQLNLIFVIDGQKYTTPSIGGNTNKVPFRTILDLIRNSSSFTVTLPSDDAIDIVAFSNEVDIVVTVIESAYEDIDDNHSLNLDVLYAYQIVCSQFYTNTNVDYIYSAELYRENLSALLRNLNPASQQLGFTYNGMNVLYDVCSGFVFKTAVGYLIEKSDTAFGGSLNTFFKYWRNIFFYQRSLKYGDYFTGSRTRPLAVGDVNVQVNSNNVSAIDITRNVMKQRFLNAVNRVRNNMSDYLSKVMDGTVPPRDDEPRFLASIKSKLSGFEVENTTSNDQGKLVKVINSTDSNYMYEVSVGSPCIILGLVSFEVPSVYSRGVERFFMFKSREDMFNPFMQYIGDQMVMLPELTGDIVYPKVPFAYQNRHSEYKQRTSYASGGFVNDKQLQSYIFLVDNISDLTPPPLTDITISPEFIRNKNYEFDRFYSSLTGIGLASYFHFIVEFDNICHPSREMDYSPTIL